VKVYVTIFGLWKITNFTKLKFERKDISRYTEVRVLEIQPNLDFSEKRTCKLDCFDVNKMRLLQTNLATGARAPFLKNEAARLYVEYMLRNCHQKESNSNLFIKK